MCDVALDKYIEESLDIFGSLRRSFRALCAGAHKLWTLMLLRNVLCYIRFC